jgi:hypothetical protein
MEDGLIRIDLHGVTCQKMNSTSASLEKTPHLGKIKYLRDGIYGDCLQCIKWSQLNAEHIGLRHACLAVPLLYSRTAECYKVKLTLPLCTPGWRTEK